MDIKKATTLGSVTVMTFMLAGGYFVKVNMPKIYTRVPWISVPKITYLTSSIEIICRQCILTILLLLQKVPIFISWIRYLSFNYHTYRLLLKVHYEHHIEPTNMMIFDSGLEEVGALIAMVFGYRLLAYISLRRMQLQ